MSAMCCWLQPLRERQHRLAQLLHLRFVGADEHEDDLRVDALDDRALREQTLAVERLAEREHGALGDDRLVEIEERGLSHALENTTSPLTARPPTGNLSASPLGSLRRPHFVPAPASAPPSPLPGSLFPRARAVESRKGEGVALLTLWSPKGGSGTSVFAAACALVLARGPGARLVDLGGDQPAIFGLGAEPRTGRHRLARGRSRRPHRRAGPARRRGRARASR